MTKKLPSWHIYFLIQNIETDKKEKQQNKQETRTHSLNALLLINNKEGKKLEVWGRLLAAEI